MNKYKLWAWLYRKAKTNVRKTFPAADVRCPNCNKWHSELVALGLAMETVPLIFGFRYRCGCCGCDTNWNSIAAPVALRCSSDGEPYKIQLD
jgi:hypothetical protein